jgi:nucleotide-binding universal stress UspA family protein
MFTFQTIVVGIDFSETAGDAVDAALELARIRQGRLHLVHVVPDVLRTGWTVEAAGVDYTSVQRDWVEGAERRLIAFAAGKGLDPRQVTTAVAVGSPATELVREAADQHASVIVLGSHGYGAVHRFVLGSVAERVVRQAACPVLVVPHRTLRLSPYEVKAATSMPE